MRWLILSVCAFWAAGTATSQQLPATDVEPPRYDGAVVKVYMTRLVARARDLAVEERIPADSLSEEVVLALRLDTLGQVVERRFLDNACSGADRCEVDPATPATRRVILKACDEMEGTWSPARRGDGRAVNYTLRMKLWFPLGKIERAVNPDPLLFMGENPDENFHAWAKMRIRYDGRFTEKGVEGVVHVRFYIEPDGRIAIGEVVQSPDERLTKEVLRVIRSSKGKWTPRKVRGVPQRTAYEYRVNYHNN